MLNMCLPIATSVGYMGRNRPDDVRVVQSLLNKFAKTAGFVPLEVDGHAGSRTLRAIRRFQQQIIRLRNPDGRVDPVGATIRWLNRPAGSTSAGEGGAVRGRTGGVKAGILEYLEAVAAHYHKTIRVTSGKRSPRDQARAMWGSWDRHLKRGMIYVYLRTHPKVQEELDGYYITAKETPRTKPADAEAARKKFYARVESIARQLSRHLSGEAVDVGLATDSKVLGALKSGLRYVCETHNGAVRCHHFDTRGIGKAPTVSPELAAKWPK